MGDEREFLTISEAAKCLDTREETLLCMIGLIGSESAPSLVTTSASIGSGFSEVSP